MKLRCAKCNKFMAIIEGDIRKGMVVLCEQCNIQREALELRYKKNREDGDVMQTYNDLFGGIFK